MLIRQEENTPIGNYFHDSGILTVMGKLEETVDEFDVETSDIISYCENLITNLKGLISTTKKCESEYQKYLQQRKIEDMKNRE